MAVFDIHDYIQPEKAEATQIFEPRSPKKEKLLSALLARSLFFLLLLADLAWGAFALFKYSLGCAIRLLTLNRKGRAFCQRQTLALKRSSVCSLALLTSLFSPSVGILFGCTYFMVFDKEGIDEVVPQSLRAQFEEFFPN